MANQNHGMHPKKEFTRFASVCCFLSVITTLGIHLYFPEPPPDFEQRVLLFKNPVYLLNRWWVIVHCLLVVTAMWGMALVQVKKAPAFTGLGFLFFAVFAIAEIARQMFVLFYMNELREQYVTAPDMSVRQNLRNLLTYAGLLTAPLFGLFIFVFALGNLCYGLSFWRAEGLGKMVGLVLLFWSACTFIILGNQFWKIEMINKITELFNAVYQPAVRMLLAIWLWKAASFEEMVHHKSRSQQSLHLLP